MGSVLTVLKLLTSGLYRRYRIFFAYFLFRIPYMTGFLVLSNLKGLAGRRRQQLQFIFLLIFYTEPLFDLLAYILVVMELVSPGVGALQGIVHAGPMGDVRGGGHFGDGISRC